MENNYSKAKQMSDSVRTVRAFSNKTNILESDIEIEK